MPLKHYAGFRIRRAILDSLRQVDWSPRTLRRRARRLEQAILVCKSRFGRDPSEPEIALELQISLESLQRLQSDLRGLDVASLQGAPNEINWENEIQYRPDSGSEDPFDQTLRCEM